jgi:hypothetical protein
MLTRVDVCDWHLAHAAARDLPDLRSLEQRGVLLTAALGLAACEVAKKMLQARHEVDMGTDHRGVGLRVLWLLVAQEALGGSFPLQIHTTPTHDSHLAWS